jgi:hypothetical protein
MFIATQDEVSGHDGWSYLGGICDEAGKTCGNSHGHEGIIYQFAVGQAERDIAGSQCHVHP